jgi:hypothetical protein
MSTSEMVKKVVSGMSDSEVREVLELCQSLLGTKEARKKTQYKGGGRKGGVKLKLAENVKSDATNMYGVEGDWVDMKRLRAGDYNGQKIIGSATVDGQRRIFF